MKAKEIEALESYLKTENEHWNEFAFGMLCEVLQQGQFEKPEMPLSLLNHAVNSIFEYHQQPLKVNQLITFELDKHKLNTLQKLFIYGWVCKYIQQTDFGEISITPVYTLLNSQKEKLKTECQPVKPLTMNIRDTLKEMMQTEIQRLPDTLKELDPVQRLNIICKLIPFVLPKVESVHHEEGED